ncbi:unnamed protein product [Leuciscus chuanchicus]
MVSSTPLVNSWTNVTRRKRKAGNSLLIPPGKSLFRPSPISEVDPVPVQNRFASLCDTQEMNMGPLDPTSAIYRENTLCSGERERDDPDNEVDGEAVDYGLTERMVSCLFEGSFKKQAKFNRFVQQWKETVTLTLEPVPVHSEKATAESSHAIPSSAFPAVFIIPKFPRDVQTKLDQKPPCKIERSDHNKIIRTLYETMALIKMFPTNDDYVKVCKALILKYPFLKDKEGNGYHTWHMSLKRKFKYERVPLVDDEEVRRMKQKFGHHTKPLQQEENTSKRAKASKKVDIIGEDDTSVASHVKVLQDQYRKTQPDARMVEERMMRTFAWRRREIANGMTVKEAINKYPFLKSPCGLFQEMGRLHDEMNICRRFEDGFKVLVPKVLSLTQRKSPLADLALEEREAALTEDVPGSATIAISYCTTRRCR